MAIADFDADTDTDMDMDAGGVETLNLISLGSLASSLGKPAQEVLAIIRRLSITPAATIDDAPYFTRDDKAAIADWLSEETSRRRQQERHQSDRRTELLERFATESHAVFVVRGVGGFSAAVESVRPGAEYADAKQECDARAKAEGDVFTVWACSLPLGKSRRLQYQRVYTAQPKR